MTHPLRPSYSTISADELLEHVLGDYQIGTPERCVFWERGTNDTYLVHCVGTRYVLRVYRHGLYPRAAIEFEIEALVYLHSQGFEVAFPIPRKSGEYLTEIAAPEGGRFVMLTTFAEGGCPKYDSPDEARLLGESVARMHSASSGFVSSHQRAHIDLQTLIEGSIAAIEPHLAHRPDELRYLRLAGKHAHNAVSAVPEDQLDVGFCHGDVHGYNAHLHEGVLTHFDFEECAYGYRCYDIATFKWSAWLDDKDEVLWPAFKAGYESARELGEHDLALMEHFVLIRHLWLIGFHMQNASDFGAEVTSDGYIDRQWKKLRKLAESCGM